MSQAPAIISAAPRPNAPADAAPEADDEFAIGEAERRAITVPPEWHGERLDRALAALVPEFSRNYLSQLIEDGALEVAGAPVTKPSRKVKAGEALTLELRPTPMSQAFVPQAIPLDVVYEDEHLAVINKPAGMVVHPAAGNWSGTLLNALLARDPRAAQLPRVGIVHRLDKDTSGLMVVARTRAAMDALVAAIAARDVHREYIALAHRAWGLAPQREVDAPIGRDARHRLRMAVVDLQRQPGKTAQTEFSLLQDADGGCLLRCVLRTGRTHQIRVHAAHIHHPLVGDTLYGGTPAAGMTRQALHARRLSFVHPVTGQALAWQAPLPADLTAALTEWGLTMPDDDSAAAKTVSAPQGG